MLAKVAGKNSVDLENSCVDWSMKEKRLYIHDVGAGTSGGVRNRGR